MGPELLYLILCNDVRTDPSNYHRLDVIQSTANPPFPLTRPLFYALVILTGGQGAGELTLQIVEDRTGNTIYRSRSRQVKFVGDPAAVVGARFHIRNCSFPAPGLYWVELVDAGSVIGRHKLFLRS